MTVAAVVAAAGPLGYIALTVLLGAFEPGYDPLHDTQSELGAVDAAHPTVMNVLGFMALGLAMLAFAVAYAGRLRRGWATWAAAALVALAGIGMVVVGFLPCDSGCVDVTTTGRLHGVLSAPGAIGLPLAAMLSARTLAIDGRFRLRWSVVSFVVGALSLASGPLVQAEVVDANGLLQRLGMWPPLLWMSTLAWRLARSEPPPDR